MKFIQGCSSGFSLFFRSFLHYIRPIDLAADQFYPILPPAVKLFRNIFVRRAAHAAGQTPIHVCPGVLARSLPRYR